MAQLTGPRARKMLVAMKAETTYGADIFGGTYVAADIVPALEIRPSQPPQVTQNLSQGGHLGRLPAIVSLPTAQVSFAMNIRGRGVAYATGTRPEADMPLRACSLSSTVDATPSLEKVTYVPTDTHESYTVYVVQENAPALKILGAHGRFRMDMLAGGGIVARFDLFGQHGGEAAVTFVPGTLSATPQYPILKSAAFQIGTENYAARIANVGFDQGNVVTPVPSINAASAVAGYLVTDREPRVTIDPEADTLAAYPWYTKFVNGTLADCTFTGGATQYNRLKFTFNNLQVVDKGWSTRNELTAFPTTLQAILAAGNDDFQLVFD